VRTGVSPGHWQPSGAKGCVLTTSSGPAHGRDAVACGRGMPTTHRRQGGLTVTVVRPRARLGRCGRPVWRRARPARPPAPGRRPGRQVKRGATRAVHWIWSALGRAAGRVSRWGWRSALGPAADGGRRPRWSAPAQPARRDETARLSTFAKPASTGNTSTAALQAPAGRPGPWSTDSLVRRGDCARTPPLGVRWAAAGRPCLRRWPGPGRRRSCRPVHGRQHGPEHQCACEFGHGCLRSIN
jgi:hypothetical protein